MVYPALALISKQISSPKHPLSLPSSSLLLLPTRLSQCSHNPKAFFLDHPRFSFSFSFYTIFVFSL